MAGGSLLAGKLAAVPAFGDEVDERIGELKLADNGAVLVNPMMGWTLYFYSHSPNTYADALLAPADQLLDFPGISSIYMRLTWDLIEPEEGVFNWTVLDTPAQRWIDRGKQLAIRITCSESWHKWATPKWVHDAGAKGYFYDDGGAIHDGGELWEPDFDDEVFLGKLDRFLAAMAKRYDGNPNVAYIDIGSFGLWGEGHTLGTKVAYADEVKIKHIDLHLKHFKKTLLAISDDFIGATAKGTHFPVTDYALANGVTLRDDSICVSTRQPYFHTDLMGLCWPKLPVIIEHEHYAGSKARGAWSGQHLYDSVMDYHASYLSIQAAPRALFDENREAIDRINSKLGYRLVVASVRLPETIAFNVPFPCSLTIGNSGVAPCYPGGHVCLTLKDGEDGIIGVFVWEGFSVRQLEPAGRGETAFRDVEARFTVRRKVNGLVAPTRMATGEIYAYISIGRLDGTPDFQLPLDHNDGHNRYFLTKLIVVNHNR